MRSNPLDNLEDLLEQFEDGFDVPSVDGVSVDLLEDDNSYLLKADLPGYDTDEIDVTYSDNQVSITAERTEAEISEGTTYIRQERRHRSTSRTVTIPGPVDEEEISAEYADGVLTVTLPKTEHETGGREIEIE